jgi:hypothetical protein
MLLSFYLALYKWRPFLINSINIAGETKRFAKARELGKDLADEVHPRKMLSSMLLRRQRPLNLISYYYFKYCPRTF